MAAPPRLWRNGMDYEPKKTYPPDYSNVPDVRDWQMSPFGRERFDLDEIQRAEKRGVKGKAELERLKLLYGGAKKGDGQCGESPRRDVEHLRKSSKKVKCVSDYLYQPYGPAVVPSISYSRPESNKPKMYNILGPSFYAGLALKRKDPREEAPVPCQSFEFDTPLRDFKNVYVPYGPPGEIRLTSDMYVPMGPAIYPKFA